MASTLSSPRPRPAHLPHRSPRRRRRSLRAVLFGGLIALLAVGGVATVRPAMIDAVRSPRAEIVPPTGDLPPIAAAAYVVVDGDTGQPLASYNADQPRPVASLAKLMTARLVLDAGPLEHTVTVPPLQIAGDESQAGLEPGDQVSRGELLDAMLVASANDAARALAVDVAGNEHSFVDMMNAEAAAAGLDATRYANPVGLDDPAQHSSADDVARLARDLMRDPTFRRIVAAESTTIAGSALPATNDLLGAYPGADGIKTGRTDQAGWCLAASATRDGRSVVVVVLGAPTERARDDAARALLDYGFQQTVTDLRGAGDGAPATGGHVEPEPAPPPSSTVTHTVSRHSSPRFHGSSQEPGPRQVSGASRGYSAGSSPKRSVGAG
jgi:serine-type D-Ala-D-Ala carboxypeptidase (penicillin-binding protein 5/6)